MIKFGRYFLVFILFFYMASFSFSDIFSDMKYCSPAFRDEVKCASAQQAIAKSQNEKIPEALKSEKKTTQDESETTGSKGILQVSTPAQVKQNEVPQESEEKIIQQAQLLEQNRLDAVKAQKEADSEEAKEKAQEEEQKALTDLAEFNRKYPEQLMNLYLGTAELNFEDRQKITKAILGTGECGDSWFGFICEQRELKKENDLQLKRFDFIVESVLNDEDKKYDDNTLLLGSFLVESRRFPGFEGIACTSLNSECRASVATLSCTDSVCENNKDLILKMYDVARGQTQIDKTGILAAMEFLQVDQSSFGFATLMQDLIGFDLNLLDSAPGVRQFFEYGTNEQMCLAKVDSFVSVNGLEIEGKSYDVEDEYTGLTSRQKMCDDLNFNICADLRSERSGIFFNDSFSLVTHVYVYNSKDYNQLVVLNAELLANSNSQKINVFNESKELSGQSVVILPSKETFSMSIYLPEIQAFNGELNGADLNGNVLLSIYEQKGDKNSTSVGSSNFEYALDYPILEMGSGPINSSALIDSGVTALDGTSIYDSSLLDRVVID